ncbi:MAG: ATP-binding protein, partial [Planctomycetota bacterium]
MLENFEKLGAFYLGKLHDLGRGAVRDDLLLYDSKDLTTHAVCVGMTGSGKTGLCLALLEEAAIDGVPAIAIDPKGDLGNLLLTFPNLEPSDFRPWIDESAAAREGLTPDQFAARTAKIWREGLADWGQSPERIEKFRSAVDVALYTPGSSAGLPLSVLGTFTAPPAAVLNDADALRERVGSAASGLLALLGVDADPVHSREHILISNLLDHAWRQGRGLDIVALIQAIQEPPFEKVGVFDLETFYPADDRLDLSMRLNNLLASPSFAGWMEGEPLDVKRLLYTPEGKPRLSIVSIAHLSESERMFFVTILLNEVLAWVRSQPGTSSLRALLYMDEVFGYFPPVANPPSKKPMLTLLKQARAYGLGVVLATQNPVDLDYKGLSNTGTWFLGRLQTERDKARVLEGLEGASVQAGATFNRQEMEATLAGLGNRVFLMNNVHEDRPVVFQTRWVLSYLRGPLTRQQIRRLMDPRKQKAAEAPTAATTSAAAGPLAASPHVPDTLNLDDLQLEPAVPARTGSVAEKPEPMGQRPIVPA